MGVILLNIAVLYTCLFGVTVGFIGYFEINKADKKDDSADFIKKGGERDEE